MSLGHGASVVRNGLVFQYDMGNTAKSWKGKPTTNLVPDPITMPSGTWAARENVTVEYGHLDPFNSRNAVKITPNSATDSYFGSRVDTLTTGTYATSFWAKASKNTNLTFNTGNRSQGNGYYIASTVSLTTDWQYFTYAGTLASNPSAHTFHVGGWNTWTDTSFEVYLAYPQVETGSFSSPFVNGTRSNTQALIDISKGDNTITASTVSYNADGTFEFDGTDDWATASSLYLGSDPVLSVEMWVKRTASFSSGGYWGFGGGSSGNGINAYANPSRANKIGWDLWGLTTFDTGQDYPLNEWIHVVWVKTASSFTTSTLKVYINGVDTPLSHTARNNGSTVNLVDGFTFGRISDNVASYYAPGVISQCLVYNRVLSSQEIKQNFEATRGRYGI